MNIYKRLILRLLRRINYSVAKWSDLPNLPVFDDRRCQIRGVDKLPDAELIALNGLLPWSSYVLDASGRSFGRAHSRLKRNEPQTIPDRRIVELNRRYPLANKTVLELGCFEGNHTCALSEFAKNVVAVDARIENIVKTTVRCAMFGYSPEVYYKDLEQSISSDEPLDCDVLHHVGVLYHLSDPVTHLQEICSRTKVAIMLDTHVANESDEFETYDVGGETYRFLYYREHGRIDPFAGMKSHAKWLFEDDLVSILKSCGFSHVDVAERRSERNGDRILIYANR